MPGIDLSSSKLMRMLDKSENTCSRPKSSGVHLFPAESPQTRAGNNDDCEKYRSHKLRGQKIPSPRPWKMIRHFHSTVRNPGSLRAVHLSRHKRPTLTFVFCRVSANTSRTRRRLEGLVTCFLFLRLRALRGQKSGRSKERCRIWLRDGRRRGQYQSNHHLGGASRVPRLALSLREWGPLVTPQGGESLCIN